MASETRRSRWSLAPLCLLPLCLLLLGLGVGCSKRVSQPTTTDGGDQMPPTVEHVVAPGETLGMIADNYYGDPAHATIIARENEIAAPDRLAAGSVLRLRFTAEEWTDSQRRIAALGPYNRGVELLGQEDLNGAEREFRLALKIAPDLVSARYNLALVLIKRGQLDEARDLLQDLSAERPDDPDIRFALGHTLFLQADFTGAAEVFTALLATDPEHRRGVFGLARSLQEGGRKEAAIAAWQRYLAIDNDSSWADVARRNLRSLQGD